MLENLAAVTETDLDIESLADQVAEERGRHDTNVDGITVEADHENVHVYLHYSTLDDPQLVLVRAVR